MKKYIVLIIIMMSTSCASSGYNASKADIMLLGYSAQMLAPAHTNYPAYGMFPGGSFMYVPAAGEQSGVICNTYGTQILCTGY